MKLQQIIAVSSIVMLHRNEHGVYAPKLYFWHLSKAGFDLTLLRDLDRNRPQCNVNELYRLKVGDAFDAEFLFSSLIGRQFQFANRFGDASLVRTWGQLDTKSLVVLRLMLPLGGRHVLQS